MQTTRHIIRNVAPAGSLWALLRANIMFQCAVTRVTIRKPFLTQSDYHKALEILLPGDIILVGQKRRVSHWFIRGIVTHVALYCENKTCIHAFADGVEQVALHDLFSEYDTCIILRPVQVTPEQVTNAISFARSSIGKPFDYGFNMHKTSAWFCSRLVFAAYEYAHAPLMSVDRKKGVVHPIDFLKSKTHIVFLSERLVEKNGVFSLRLATH